MYIVRRTLYVPTTSRVPRCPLKHLVKAFLHAALSTIVIVTGVLCWVTSWLESDSQKKTLRFLHKSMDLLYS